MDKCEDSVIKAVEDIGSMISCPVCIAARTERLDSQLKDGAKSNRTVGSLRVEQETRISEYGQESGVWKLTSLRSTVASGTVRGEGWASPGDSKSSYEDVEGERQTEGILDREGGSRKGGG